MTMDTTNEASGESGGLAGSGRIPAHNLESDSKDDILDLIDPREIWYGYNANAAAKGRFRGSARLTYVHKERVIYIRTATGTYKTDYHTIDEILGDLGDDFIRANHGIFVNHTKIQWLEKPSVDFQLAGFARRGESDQAFDEWIVMSRTQGRAVYNRVRGGVA